MQKNIKKKKKRKEKCKISSHENCKVAADRPVCRADYRNFTDTLSS